MIRQSESTAVAAAPPRSDSARRLTQVLLAGICLCVVAAVHYPALSALAISLDDRQYLIENHLVRNPSVHSVQRFFAEIRRPSTVDGYYQPLSMTSLMLDYAMGGRPDNLRPFHRTSLLIHLANVALLMWLVARLFGRAGPAMVAGLLYGLHPLTVEPLAWVGERKTLLATFFALACLICYVRYARRGHRWAYVATMCLYVLGLLSKPTVVPLPALMLLLDGWPLNRLSWRAVLEKIPLLVIAAVDSVVAISTQGAQVQTPYPAGTIALVIAHNVPFYLGKILVPVGLTSVYPFPEPLSLGNPAMLAMGIASLLLTAGALWSIRYTRAVFFGISFFFVAIFPTFTNVGYSPGIAADKYAYFPLAGMVMLVAWMLNRAWPSGGEWRGARKLATGLVVAGLVVGYGLGTRYQYRFWRDTEALFRRMVALAPNSSSGYMGLAAGLAQKNQLDEIIKLLGPVVQRHPEWYDVQTNLGNTLARRNQTSEAIEHLQLAVQYAPTYLTARHSLAVTLMTAGRRREAISHLQALLALKPEHLAARVALARALTLEDRLAEALEQSQKAIELGPMDLAARRQLAEILVRMHRYAEASVQLQVIVEQEPLVAAAHHNLANALALSSRPAEAEARWRQAVQLGPTYLPAHLGLADLLASSGRRGEAVQEYQHILELDPANSTARDELQRLGGVALPPTTSPSSTGHAGSKP